MFHYCYLLIPVGSDGVGRYCDPRAFSSGPRPEGGPGLPNESVRLKPSSWTHSPKLRLVVTKVERGDSGGQQQTPEEYQEVELPF